MPMKNPPHPGRIVRQDCIEALELTVTKAAELLGVDAAGPEQSGQRKRRVFLPKWPSVWKRSDGPRPTTG